MKNKVFLLSAAAFMFFAVFAGLSTKSIASDATSNPKSEVLLLFGETGETQIINENDVNSTADSEDTLDTSTAIEKNIETVTNDAEKANSATTTKSVIELVWFNNGDAVFPRGTTAVITDVLTRKSFAIYRKGGANHADVEPLTAADSKIMKSIYGGTWSWDRRAIWVEIDGQLYAGSMNGMPHGKEIISDNNFNGHFCVHFTNSRTHATNRVDKRHQAAIKIALDSKP